MLSVLRSPSSNSHHSLSDYQCLSKFCAFHRILAISTIGGTEFQNDETCCCLVIKLFYMC